MGGPGSGGFKNAPGDTETHAAWDVIEQEDGNTQVGIAKSNARVLGLINHRSYHRCDASTVLERWRSTHLDSELISSNARTTWTP